jgi:hypothetical protein
MASAAVVGGVLLALIEGMGIMFTKMTAPPVPTAEDYERAMLQDPTAPPTMGSTGIMSQIMSSSGGSTAPPSPTPTSHDAADFASMDTTFSTEGSSSGSGQDESSGGWFSFGK